MGSYPVVNAAYSNANSSQFIHKLNSSLSTTDYSTVFGSGSTASINISPTAFLVDKCGNVYVSGWGGGFNNAASLSGVYNPFAGGSTNGLPLTVDAQQSSTDGSDFYFFVLERDATGLLYGTYFGDPNVAEHTDGGTSRFDPDGVVYQSVCAACDNPWTFPTTPGVAYPNSGTAGQAFFCNMGSIKFEFDFKVLKLLLMCLQILQCVPMIILWTSLQQEQTLNIFGILVTDLELHQQPILLTLMLL